jgi:heme/copper-type cytochrome/quinol oxidase subunit 3
MIRPVLTELALFLAPFAVYAIYLVATRAGVLHPDSWPLGTLAWLTIAALVLMAGSFIVLAHFSGDAPNSEYVPAHIENGKLVPGTTE